MNNKDTPFDHQIIEDLGYESAMPYIEGKYGEKTRKDYDKLILNGEVRITLLKYKDRFQAVYSPYYCPTKLEHRGLEEISYPKITRDLLDELRDSNTTLIRVQNILKGL